MPSKKPTKPLGDIPPAHPTDADIHRMIHKAAQKLGVEHQIGPGASDQELYPTDQGAVEFRIARGRKRRGGTNVA
jgi:hypothetical protein